MDHTCYHCWDASARHYPRPWTVFRILFCCIILAALASSQTLVKSQGTTSLTQEKTRHAKVMVPPEYPELARKFNVKGAVRIELLVAPDGRVKKTKVLGGNPVLVQASLEALRRWKYEPAKTESTVMVKFDFDPATSIR